VPSLREIQQTISTLWLDKEARIWLVKRRGPRPQSLQGASDEILKNADHAGLQLYSELLNFGHQDVMASVYPYCSKLLGKKWEETVEDYLRKLPPDHYNFNRLCSRFSQYLTEFGGEWLKRWPFLAELADYEWIELEKLEQDVRIEALPHQPLTDLAQVMSLKPVLNPSVTVRHYSYDILAIADNLEEGKRISKVAPISSFVAAYRHPQTQRCCFAELGAAAAKAVEESSSSSGNGLSYQQLIPLTFAIMGEADPQSAMMQFLEMVEELQEMRIFVGSQPV
jgi:Putative DNA-binding domain